MRAGARSSVRTAAKAVPQVAHLLEHLVRFVNQAIDATGEHGLGLGNHEGLKMVAPSHFITPIGFVDAAALDPDGHRALVGIDALSGSLIVHRFAANVRMHPGIVADSGSLARVP